MRYSLFLKLLLWLYASFFQHTQAGNIFSGNRLSTGAPWTNSQRRTVSRSSSFDSPTERPPPVDPALISLGEDLYRLDQQGNAAKEDLDWKVNTRSQTGRLFTRFNDALLFKPTYSKFIALLDNYNPNLGRREDVTPVEKQEQSSFLDAVINTPVMKKAWEFLQAKRLASSSAQDFKALLQRIWFTIYERRGQPDTSGFEHVFVGEIDGNQANAPVTGFHNWIRYYLEEKAGRAVYQKWKGQADPDIYGLQFSWNNHLKIKSTMAIGESPEMSLAVLTVCFLAAPNTECKLRMNGAPVSVVTHKWTTSDPKEFYVASAYYDS